MTANLRDFELADQYHRAGRLGEAELLYRSILSRDPGHFGALHRLGMIAFQVGQGGLAAELIGRAIVINPNEPTAQANFGEVLRTLGRLEESLTHFRRAIALNPGNAETHFNMGNALKDMGQIDAAIAAYRRAIELQPEHSRAWNNLGIALSGQGDFEGAIDAYGRALQLNPHFPEASSNLGCALARLGRLTEAIAAHRQAVAIQVDYAEGHINLGNALRDHGQFAEAIAAYRRAIELTPMLPEVHNNLGIALADQNQFEEAANAYQQALALKPDYVEAHSNLGLALAKQGRLDEAVAAHRRAIACQDGYAPAYNNLAGALAEQGRVDESVATYRRALEIAPQQPAVQSSLIHTLQFLPGDIGEVISAEQRLWNRKFGTPGEDRSRSYSNVRDPDRKLRIGYVSPFLRQHVVGRNLMPLFRHHDRHQFEIWCYSGAATRDPLTEEFRRLADGWRDTVGIADEALAEVIRHDGVDVLVDLAQHMAGNRLTVFARQPAPVQLSFAGYPATTGVGTIGGRISDRYLESDIGVDLRPTERVCLVDSFWCYDPCGVEMEVGDLPAKTSGRVTFGCLNNFAKINEPLLKLWAQVLRKAGDARLVILSPAGSHRERALEVMELAGVERSRVIFETPRSHREYLELYRQLDVVLDPFPYGGHTTSLDALWMGVPVVSLAGESTVSRAGVSMLSNLGFPELVAWTEEEYVEIATRLAGDLSRLSELRATLRTRMESSVLMDAPRFARQIEAVYRAMWREWCLTGSKALP